MVTAGVYYWAAVTEHGRLYTWGKGCQEDASPGGLDHDNMQHQLVPTFVVPHLLQGARIGRCQKLLPPIALACVMVSAAPTSAPAGGQQEEVAEAGRQDTDSYYRHQHGLCVCHDAGGAGSVGSDSPCVMARRESGGSGGGYVTFGRYDEGQGVALKMMLAVSSC